MPFESAPGALSHPDELESRIAEAVAARRAAPRTRHLHPDGTARFANRLSLETSPYLLQHSHNPVDWRPWGAEAFEAARASGKPVFLSVGYATCHWCHVMEEESFEDLEIARLLNERFICIKLDREERPDIDAIYMQAVQLLTQHGGWPMSVFLTPDAKPFYGGTYFPPRDGMRGARFGFVTLLNELSRIYSEEKDKALRSAEEISRAIEQGLSGGQPAGVLPGVEVLHHAVSGYTASFDPRYGGLRRAPKFPSSFNVPLLLRYWKRTGDESALKMARLTLEQMAAGGLFDQIGGGFHRYSTDQAWLVPHFEKMLYDNALLAQAYLEGYLATRDERLKLVCTDVLDYVAKEMVDPGGAFWSATDADSEGEEGRFFIWTPAQIKELLGPADGARFCELFDISEAGNFEGRNIPHLQTLATADERAFIEQVRPVLYQARTLRTPPLTDDKVLTAWNGLMISAYARAGLWLSRPDYVECAKRAAEYLLKVHLKDGKLLRTSLGGAARHPGLLEDHANLAAGLVDLFEATSQLHYLDAARALQATLKAEFADESGGYYRTPTQHEKLLAREKPLQDGAEPCGNSVAALTLLRLEALTGEASYRQEAEGILRSAASILEQVPAALGQMLLAVDFLTGDPLEIVLVRPDGGDDAALFGELARRFLPNAVVMRISPASSVDLPLARERGPIAGKAAAYVCRRGACGLPVTSEGDLARQLDGAPAAP